MIRLQLAIFDSPGGLLLLDCSRLARNVKASTNEHGFEALTWEMDTSFARSFWLYDRPGIPHVVLTTGAGIAWEGRLEDVTITASGRQCTAYGYWRALSDVPYTALWSTTSVVDFLQANFAQTTARAPDLYSMDSNNRLFIGLTKGTVYRYANDAGEWFYCVPSAGARQIVAISFACEVLLPATFLVQCNIWNQVSGAYTAGTGISVWALTATGALQTGTQTLTFAGTPRDVATFIVYWDTVGGTTYVGETGAAYAKITNIRIQTTTSAALYASEIAAALANYINGINPSQLSASAALIQSPAVDLTDEIYEDQYPADILTHLAALGDNQTPPRQWEAGVWENRRLHFRPRGSAGRAWYIDATDPQIQRTLEQLRNSAYATYQDANGVTLRGATSSNANSIVRYGLTRQAAVSTQTTSSTQAATQRDAYLQDNQNPAPRSGITTSILYDGYGARWPLWAARSGDTVTFRNLSPTLSMDIDRIRTFRIARTEYDANADTLMIESETPTPSLDVLVARIAANIRR